MDLTASSSILTSQLNPHQGSSSAGVPDGWAKHWHPTMDFQYFSNLHERVVTRDNILKPEILRSVTDTARDVLRDYSDRCEIFVHGSHIQVVNHETDVMDRMPQDQVNPTYSRRKAAYWIHIGDFPFNRTLTAGREAEAIEVLEIALAQNIIKPGGGEHTPFSKQETQGCLEFFTLNYPPGNYPKDRDNVAKTMMIAHVLSNFFFHQSNRTETTTPYKQGKKRRGRSLLSLISRALLVIACFGIPPDYDTRFNNARRAYKKTIQPVIWETFVGQIRKERGDMNVVSGLLLSASVAFLATPGLVNASQFLIIVSMGLSLGCVIMGINPAVGEKLSEIEQLSLQAVSERPKLLENMARALNQHTIILLLSILFFFLALFVFSVWSLVQGIFYVRSYTNILFFGLSVLGLLTVAGSNLRWNTTFQQGENKNDHWGSRSQRASGNSTSP